MQTELGKLLALQKPFAQQPAEGCAAADDGPVLHVSVGIEVDATQGCVAVSVT